MTPSAELSRVLIVDDNRDAADLLALLVGLHRCETRVAYDGLEALRVAREWVPDCVVSDIHMPGLDGYALARALRADPSLAGARLIAHSGVAGEPLARLAAEAGFDHRVNKGDDPSRLLDLVKAADRSERPAAPVRDASEREDDAG